MRRVLAACWLLCPTFVGAQELILCLQTPPTACSSSVQIGTGNTGDKAWLWAGKDNDNATAFATAIATLQGQLITLTPSAQIIITPSVSGPPLATFTLPASIPGPVELVGVTTATAATAGNVGEVIDASLAKGSAAALTTGQTVQILSESLTAGNWECSATAYYTAASGSLTYGQSGLNTTSGTTLAPQGTRSTLVGASLATVDPSATSMPVQFLVGSTTTIYLTATISTAATVSGYGNIHCKRIG